MTQSRPFYFWQVSRASNITGKWEVELFHDRRPADRLFRIWRKDPDTKDKVYLYKTWAAWNRPSMCRMANGRPDKVELIQEKPVFKYAQKIWEEHERLREFKENW